MPRKPSTSQRGRVPVADRSLRASSLAEGRLLNIELPKQACVGDVIRLKLGQVWHRVLVEDDDIRAWDLGAETSLAFGELLRLRVQQARQRREGIVDKHTNVYRLVHDAADALPGVVIDAYQDVAVVQTYGSAFARHADDIAAALTPLFTSIRVVERKRHGARAGSLDRWYGPEIRSSVVFECGMRFRVRFDDRLLGTGLFADQREQRQRLRAWAVGKRVLNLFAYAGGFTVAAAVGGAQQVTHVDLSKACSRWCAHNLGLNGLSPSQHRLIADDARSYLKRAQRRQELFDIIVVDPPTFAVGNKPFHSQRDLGELLSDCLKVLAPGGIIMVSINTRGVEENWLSRRVLDACRQNQRFAVVLGRGEQGVDFPTLGETTALDHLRAIWVRVD